MDFSLELLDIGVKPKTRHLAGFFGPVRQCLPYTLVVIMADLSGIVKGFLLNAPPGEFLEVVSGA